MSPVKYLVDNPLDTNDVKPYTARMKLPRKATAKTRTFKEDNEWLIKRAKENHTVAAVIVHELIEKAKEATT